jgi:DNA-binding transcriptional regulator YdaS (Cro superfamily)
MPESPIDICGGTNALAESLGLTAPAVSQWKLRGIPRKHHRRMIELSRNRLTFEAINIFNESLCALTR